MNKGTAVVGFLLSFLAGVGLMWGIARSSSTTLEAATASVTEVESSPVPIASDDPAWGNADAPVTIVEVSDFECPFCARVITTVNRIKSEYGREKVRIVWKNYPSPNHPSARPAAEAAATVHALGGDFWRFNELAFSGQQQLTPENFGKWAALSGVDVPRFTADFNAKKHAAKIDRDLAASRRLGINGTPYFLVNGKPLSGAQPFEKFRGLIDEQLAASQGLAKAGMSPARISLQLTKQNFAQKAAAAPSAGQQATTQPRPEDTTVWKVPVSDEDPTRGSAGALITIVAFSDFQCPFCARVEATLTKILDDYAGDVRIVWKDNPMSFHKRAKPAAVLARVAFAEKGNDGFWAAHAALFDSQKNLEDAGLEEVAKKVGLSWFKVETALERDTFAAVIDRGVDLASDFNVPGPPHFFVNGRRIAGAQPYGEFKKLIDAQLVIAKDLVRRGVARDRVYREIMKTAQTPPLPERRDVPAPTKNNPSKGPPNAKVVIQEFSDFQCPFCSRVTPTVAQILEAYPKDVKVVWRHMPLSFHQDAPLAAEAAQEAFAQAGSSAFWKYHDKLFANQQALGRADLEKYAAELGLDLGRFKAALDSRTHKAVVDGDIEAAKRAGVVSTPAFTINGYPVIGAYPFQQFDKVIKLALKKD